MTLAAIFFAVIKTIDLFGLRIGKNFFSTHAVAIEIILNLELLVVKEKSDYFCAWLSTSIALVSINIADAVRYASVKPVRLPSIFKSDFDATYDISFFK